MKKLRKRMKLALGAGCALVSKRNRVHVDRKKEAERMACRKGRGDRRGE